MRHVEGQVALGPRPTGSEVWLQTGYHGLKKLTAASWATEVQKFGFMCVQARYLIGRSGSAGDPVIVVGAHYDTRRRADRDLPSPASLFWGRRYTWSST